jgi:hypothetical protein
MSGQFAGSLKPDLVIPFKLDKAAAKAALVKHYEGKPFLPQFFKDENRIEEIKGVYIPFWLFDATCDCHGTFKCGVLRSWTDGRNRYTETKYYSVVREGSVIYEKVPVDGASKVPDNLMESIEPFEYNALVDFQTAYLSGYFANVYDVDAQACIPHAEKRMSETSMGLLQGSISGYNSVELERSDVSFHAAHSSYALLPVWMLSTTYKGTIYSFAMNGQTGRLAGDLPVDSGKYRKSILLWGGVIFLIVLIAALLIFVLPILLGK